MTIEKFTKYLAWLSVFYVLCVIMNYGFLMSPAQRHDYQIANEAREQHKKDHDKFILLSVKCENAMRPNLKAPASAKFSEPWEPGNNYNHQKDKWAIYGFVDSQNSFGAMLRTNYACVFQETSPDNFNLLGAQQL